MEDAGRSNGSSGSVEKHEARAKDIVAVIRSQRRRSHRTPRLRDTIYDVLARLVERACVGAAGAWSSTRPGADLAVERLVVGRREAMTALEQDAGDVISRLGPEFQAGQAHSDPLEYIEVLRDRGAISERFTELQANVKHEILVFTKPPYATPPQDNLGGIEVARTHVARSVYELDVLDDAAMALSITAVHRRRREARSWSTCR